MVSGIQYSCGFQSDCSHSSDTHFRFNHSRSPNINETSLGNSRGICISTDLPGHAARVAPGDAAGEGVEPSLGLEGVKGRTGRGTGPFVTGLGGTRDAGLGAGRAGSAASAAWRGWGPGAVGLSPWPRDHVGDLLEVGGLQIQEGALFVLQLLSGR